MVLGATGGMFEARGSICLHALHCLFTTGRRRSSCGPVSFRDWCSVQETIFLFFGPCDVTLSEGAFETS